MRLVPRSMRGQLIVLLLLAVLVAHIIGLWARQARDEGLHPLTGLYMLDRVAGAYQIARLSTPEHAERLLSALSSTGTHFWITSSAPYVGASMTAEEVGLARDLSTRLSQQPLPPIQIQVSSSRRDEVSVSKEDEPPRIIVRAFIELPDGRWLGSSQQSAERSPWWRPLQFSIPVSTVPVLLVVILFIRRILKPIRALEKAAVRLSRGEQGGPLPVIGPRESRELTTAFNLMEERQKRYVEDRTRMLAAISHDLRTPITSLRIRAEMVEDTVLRLAMTRTLEDMASMVEETLRFSRDESVDVSSEEADLAKIAMGIVEELSKLGHRVHWSGPQHLSYRCRPLSIKRALGNLVDNAVRYGSAVEIHAQSTSPYDEIVIQVCDNGPGIDPALFERAFEPFERLDPARSEQKGGVGLGLSIARSCVQAHGGRLQLANHPEGGLIASIILPTC